MVEPGHDDLVARAPVLGEGAGQVHRQLGHRAAEDDAGRVGTRAGRRCAARAPATASVGVALGRRHRRRGWPAARPGRRTPPARRRRGSGSRPDRRSGRHRAAPPRAAAGSGTRTRATSYDVPVEVGETVSVTRPLCCGGRSHAQVGDVVNRRRPISRPRAIRPGFLCSNFFVQRIAQEACPRWRCTGSLWLSPVSAARPPPAR